MPTLPPALPKMVGIARVCSLTCLDGVCKILPCQYSVIGKKTERSEKAKQSKRKGMGSKRKGKGTKRVVKSRRGSGSHTRKRRN